MTPNRATDLAGWISDWQSHDWDSDSMPLVKWLGEPLPPVNVQLDLACRDLMRRRRINERIRVENYLEDLPQIETPVHLLDLIDAEICVRRELGQDTDLASWRKRFPNLVEEIRSLLAMQQPTRIGQLTSPTQDSRWPAVGRKSSNRYPTPITILSQLVSSGNAAGSNPGEWLAVAADAVPDWFAPQNLVSQGPGHWLMRGIHQDDNRALALKVIELPRDLSQSTAVRILDIAESFARFDVAGPSHQLNVGGSADSTGLWLRPEAAAIRDGRLLVLRPWIEGMSWQTSQWDLGRRLESIAKIAFALANLASRSSNISRDAQNAHSPMFHGGIAEDNLWIDHHGILRCVDGGSSRSGIRRLLDPVRSGVRGGVDGSRQDVIDLVCLLSDCVLRRCGDWESGKFQGRPAPADPIALLQFCQSIVRCTVIPSARNPSAANSSAAFAAESIGGAIRSFLDGGSLPSPIGQRRSFLPQWFVQR